MIYFKELSQLETNDKRSFINWKSDFDLCDKIMSLPVSLNSEELDFWIQKNENDPNQFFKCVKLKSNNQLIGLARLMYIDTISMNAEVGLYIGDKEYRGENLGSEILKSLLSIAKDEFNMNKLFANIHVKNIGSIKLFEKFGFITEGVLREHYYSSKSNEFISVVIMSKFL